MSEQILSFNLEHLMRAHGGLSVSELARKILVPQPTLHHILDGSTKKPRKETLDALSKFFSITIDQLIGNVPLPSIIPDAIKEKFKITTIPIIDWEQIKSWDGPKENLGLGEIILEKTLDQNSFALVIKDSSMGPMFPEKSVLIFDPTKNPKDRDFVIVYFHQNDTILFNRIFIDETNYYIKQDQSDGNAKLIKLKLPIDKIMATLIEVRLKF